MITNTLFFSTEPGVSHNWQSNLLVKTCKKNLNLEHWNIVRAVAIYPDKSHVSLQLEETLAITGCAIHFHSNYAAEITSADCYSPYNKILALKSYLAENNLPNDHLITIVDPDFLVLANFLPQITFSSHGGNDCISETVFAEKWQGLDLKSEFGTMLGRYLKLDPEQWHSTPSVGVPVTISVANLRIILADWLDFTQAIRRGFNTGEFSISAFDAWCAEMWGFMAAIAHNNINLQTINICRFTEDSKLDNAFFIHYCHAIYDRNNRSIWDKRWYDPSANVQFNSELARSTVGAAILGILEDASYGTRPSGI